MIALAGGALVLVILRDVFHEILHPTGTGTVGTALRRLVWRLTRAVARRRPRLLTVAGPLSLVVTLLAWSALLVLGWALVFHQFQPEVAAGSAVPPGRQGRFVDALYLSAVTLATLGYGDFVPTATLPRLLAAGEALVGFALLTAGISWVLSLYPVLARRRTLARRLAALHRLRQEGSSVVALQPAVAERHLAEITSGLAHAYTDLAQSPISYVFHDEDEDSSLARWTAFALRLAAEASAPERPPELRHAGAALRLALDDYAALLRRMQLHDAPDSTEGTLAAYARDHLREAGPLAA